MKQQLFDKAVAGVLAQGAACTLDGVCRYLNAQGHKCVLGHMITEYDEDFEELVPFGPRSDATVKRQVKLDAYFVGLGFNSDDRRWLMDLRACHDDACYNTDFIWAFKDKVKFFATQHGLAWNHE